MIEIIITSAFLIVGFAGMIVSFVFQIITGIDTLAITAICFAVFELAYMWLLFRTRRIKS